MLDIWLTMLWKIKYNMSFPQQINNLHQVLEMAVCLKILEYHDNNMTAAVHPTTCWYLLILLIFKNLTQHFYIAY